MTKNLWIGTVLIDQLGYIQQPEKNYNSGRPGYLT